jgi:hypothetical protein
MSKNSKIDFETLKVKNLNVKNLKARQACIKNLKSETGNIKDINSSNINTDNLIVSNINGIPYCPNDGNIVSGIITPISYINGEAQKPTNSGFNEIVFNQLWDLTQLTGAFLNLDSSSGRYRNSLFSQFYNCNICPSFNTSLCPQETKGNASIIASIDGNILNINSFVSGEIEIGQKIFWKEFSPFITYTIIEKISEIQYKVSNKRNDYSFSIPQQSMITLSDFIFEECINVPMNFYGIETIPIKIESKCSNVVSSVSYNLNIVNRTLETRLAAVYVLIGYIDPNDSENAILQSIEIDTKQFDPSLFSFGEQMNNTILLPTDLVNLASMKDGILQLVVYVEDGVDVIIPNNRTQTQNSIKTRNTSTTVSPQTNYSISYTTNTSSGLLIDSRQTLLKYFTPVVIGNTEYFLVSDIRKNGTKITLSGGGGGSAINQDESTGGGGQGYQSFIDLGPTNNTEFYFNIIFGTGGVGTDGSSSIITFFNQNLVQTVQFTAKGGKVSSIDGGDGFSGGGGAVYVNPMGVEKKGKGGKGIIQENNGEDGILDEDGEFTRGGNGGGNGGGKGGLFKIGDPAVFFGYGGGGGEIINNVSTGGNGEYRTGDTDIKATDGIWGGGGGGGGSKGGNGYFLIFK